MTNYTAKAAYLESLLREECPLFKWFVTGSPKNNFDPPRNKTFFGTRPPLNYLEPCNETFEVRVRMEIGGVKFNKLHFIHESDLRKYPIKYFTAEVIDQFAKAMKEYKGNEVLQPF